jgi:putative DNA primase/helicase
MSTHQIPTPNPTPFQPQPVPAALKRRIEKAISVALAPDDSDGRARLIGAMPLFSPDEEGEGEMWISEVEALGIEVPSARAAGQPCPKCFDGRLGLRHNGKNGQSFWACSNYRSGCKYTEESSQDVRNADPQPAMSDADEQIALRPFSDIEPKPVQWLWTNRIPCGGPTLFTGIPGVGKSLATDDIAARVSRGLPWPDGSGNAPLGDVIILCAEDSSEHTIRPRLDEAGADVSRVHELRAFTSTAKERTERQFNLEKDVARLRKALQCYPNTKLIIIDPISAYIGDRNEFKDAEVRQMLAPLAKLADDLSIAVIGIKHFNKAADMSVMFRSSGSIAYVAMARAAWAFVPDPKDSRTLMLQVKSNLGPKVEGLAFRVVKRDGAFAPAVEWLGSTAISAEEALNGKPGPKGERLEEAKHFLKELLSGGSKPVNEIKTQAREAGISWDTLRRAKDALNIFSEKDGANGWRWKLEDDLTTIGPSSP